MKKQSVWVILAACLALGLGLGVTAKVRAGAASREAAIIRPVDDAWRAALPRDPEQATAAYLARISPEARRRSDAYFTGGYWLQLWSFLVTLGSFGLLLATGASAAMRDFAERATRRRSLQTMLYAVLFMAATWVIQLPLGVAGDFIREHRYGMATQSFPHWMKDQVVGLLVSTVILALALAALYKALRRFPRTWWIWGTGGGILLLAFVMFIGPSFIDPLFNAYKPLPEGPARQAILSLAKANGVPAKDVLWFDASRQTNRVSANVSGILGTASVRLNDNLLKRCTLPEIKSVMAHELGHYVLNHLYKALMFFALVFLAGFAFVAWAFEALRSRAGSWGIRDVGDPAGLPLLAGLFTLFLFILTPALNTDIRVQETEADQFGVNASMEPDGFAEAQLQLVEYRKADPGPVEEFLFFDHPSPRKRILTAMRYKAEHFPR